MNHQSDGIVWRSYRHSNRLTAAPLVSPFWNSTFIDSLDLAFALFGWNHTRVCAELHQCINAPFDKATLFKTLDIYQWKNCTQLSYARSLHRFYFIFQSAFCICRNSNWNEEPVICTQYHSKFVRISTHTHTAEPFAFCVPHSDFIFSCFVRFKENGCVNSSFQMRVSPTKLKHMSNE